MLLFAGNVLIKPATSPLLRGLGFRTVLIGSIVGGALALVAIALLQPTTPAWVMAMIFVLSGVFRSIGFSAYNSLQFADIDAADLADANTLSSTLQQVAAGLGVAVGALLLRLSDEALGTPAEGLITAVRTDLPAAGVDHDATAGPGDPAPSLSRRRADPPLGPRPELVVGRRGQGDSPMVERLCLRRLRAAWTAGAPELAIDRRVWT